MTDSNSTSLAAGLVSGYLLGRGGKTKIALGVAAFIASKKLRGDTGLPGASEALDKVAGDSPLGRLGKQLRGELLTAGRSAITATANRRMDALTEAIEGRTRSLDPEGDPDGDGDGSGNGKGNGDGNGDGSEDESADGGGSGRGESGRSERAVKDEEPGRPPKPEKPAKPKGTTGDGRRTTGSKAGRAREREAARSRRGADTPEEAEKPLKPKPVKRAPAPKKTSAAPAGSTQGRTSSGRTSPGRTASGRPSSGERGRRGA